MNILKPPHWKVLDTQEREHDRRHVAEYLVPLEKCPFCRSKNLSRFGTRPALFMDIPHGKRVGIEVVRQRYRCKDCGKTTSQPLPDIDDKRFATRQLVAYIKARSLRDTFSRIADDVGVSVNTVRNVFEEHVAALEKTSNPETPDWLGIDEVHIVKQMRCVLANVRERTVLDMLPSRTKQVVYRRLLKLDRSEVEIVTIDMHRPYLEAAQAALPKALVIVDKWHVLKYANQGLETVRKSLRASLTPKVRRQLMHDRHILLKRRHALDATEQTFLHDWMERFPELRAAYELKEGFYAIYAAKDKFDAKWRYRDWLMSVPKEMEEPFNDLLRAVENWQDYIFSYFDTQTRVTNAYTESLNALIKHVHRNGRGYSFPAIRAKILFTNGVRKTHRPRFERGGWGDTTSMMDLVHQEPDLLDFGADISTLTRLYESGSL
jgi:transposase